MENLLQKIQTDRGAVLQGQESKLSALIANARALIALLEPRSDAIIWMAWAEVAIRIAIDLGNFEFLDSNDATAKTGDGIVTSVGGDRKLIGPVFQNLPSYLADTQYNDPKDINSGPLQHGHDTNLGPWDWKKERSTLELAFNNHMAG
ncbi:hypothetical protein MMC25_004203 [Agyrium rufum]|nr:hypothetical protein [Agyrium rufum]